MARPRQDKTQPAMPNRRKLNALLLRKLKPGARPYLIYDTEVRRLVVQVQPTGHAAYKCLYPFHGRPRWLHIANVRDIGLAEARKLASAAMYQVAQGKDPAAERKADRSNGTFQDLAAQYVDRYAKRNNKSWKQAEALVQSFLLPKWGKLQASAITRSDVRTLFAKMHSPTTANQTLAAASAIFSWAIREEFGAIKVNPCHGIERNATASRERVLSAAEVPLFWRAFESAGLVRCMALRMILLTGQRPGEVLNMRTEHIEGGWWTLPGAPVPALGWPGTKNAQTHRVWLPVPAQAILTDLEADGRVFANARGNAINDLDKVMRTICKAVGGEKVTAHDMRRHHGSTITGLGFGREAMNRIQNHREGGIADVYDRHHYAEENKRIMEAVAARIMDLATGNTARGNVVSFR